MLEAARLLQHFIIQIIIEYGSTIETKPSGTHPKLLWETKCGCAFFISVGVCCVCARAWEVLTGLVPKAIVREGGEKDGAGDRREKKWRWLGRSTRAEIRWNSSRICRRHLQSVEQLSDEWKTFGGKNGKRGKLTISKEDRWFPFNSKSEKYYKSWRSWFL